jgi:hypothetical protein
MVQLDYYDINRTPDNDKVAAFARRWAGRVLTRAPHATIDYRRARHASSTIL